MKAAIAVLSLIVAPLAGPAAAPAASGAAGAVSTAYRQAIEDWRRQREERLRAEDGWLSVAGLHWLREGANRFGTDPANEIVLPGGSAPALAGVITLQTPRVSVRLQPGVAASIEGQAVAERELRTDQAGRPDVLTLGRLRLSVIERSGRYGLRLRDPDNPRRRGFTGLQWFPVDETYRVSGRFVPAPTPRTLSILNVLGQVVDMASPGHVVFTLAGRSLRLDPVLEEGSAELFFIFRDSTAGRDTYPAGRYLYAVRPREGTVVLDFNKAYSPPCAFTDFATCPLPPKQNRLSIAIPAGEKKPAGH